MPKYEVLAQRIYLVRTREEVTFLTESSSPAEALETAKLHSSLYHWQSSRTWEILKEKHTVKAVHVCRIKRLPDRESEPQPEPQPKPFPFSRRVRMALGLS